MNKKYIQAFSIIETVVSMVITAVVIGLIFIIFTIMSERMQDFKNQNQYVADLNRMTYSINKDLFDSDKMVVDSENNITFIAYSGTTIKYNCTPNYFLRTKANFIDTFKIPIHRIHIDTLQNKDKRIVFERMSLTIDVNKEPMNLKFFKKIYPNELLKKEFRKHEF